MRDHDELCELSSREGRRVAESTGRGRFRTKPRFKHPRTDGTALLLSTTTALFIIDLIAQHEPQADSQLARHRHARLAQPFLHQFVAIEPLQLGIAACRVSAGLVPEKTQQRTALLGSGAESLPGATGVFAWNQAHIAGQCLAIGGANGKNAIFACPS
jgi:hypothetical protein